MKIHSTASRFVIGPSFVLFSGVYVCTFQPGNCTGWGSEGVNRKIRTMHQREHSRLLAHTHARTNARTNAHTHTHARTRSHTRATVDIEIEIASTGL